MSVSCFREGVREHLRRVSEHDIAEAADAVRNIGADLVANSLRQAVEEVGLLSVITLDKLAPLEGGQELPALAKY
jgi:hypothetical protein